MYYIMGVALVFLLMFYFSMSYFVYMFVKAKRRTVFEGLSRVKKVGIFLVLPVLTVVLFVYHVLTKNKEVPENGQE